MHRPCLQINTSHFWKQASSHRPGLPPPSFEQGPPHRWSVKEQEPRLVPSHTSRQQQRCLRVSQLRSLPTTLWAIQGRTDSSAGPPGCMATPALTPPTPPLRWAHSWQTKGKDGAELVGERLTSGWAGGEEPARGQRSPQRHSDKWNPGPGPHSVLEPLPSTPALGKSKARSPRTPLPPRGRTQSHLGLWGKFSILSGMPR